MVEAVEYDDQGMEVDQDSSTPYLSAVSSSVQPQNDDPLAQLMNDEELL